MWRGYPMLQAMGRKRHPPSDGPCFRAYLTNGRYIPATSPLHIVVKAPRRLQPDILSGKCPKVNTGPLARDDIVVSEGLKEEQRAMQKKWLFAGLLVLLALMTACGPSGKPSSANTIPTATPGANPGGAATATPAPTATPVPPTQVPPANAGIAGVWAGSAPNGAATHAIIAECGG